MNNPARWWEQLPHDYYQRVDATEIDADHRLPGVTASYLQLTGFDLQQDSRGQWLVVEDHLGVAEGASYALKKRQIMRQIAPRLFDGMEILPIEDFAAQVLDVMRDLVKNPDGGEQAALRSPQAILDEIATLDAQSAKVLQDIRSLL